MTAIPLNNTIFITFIQSWYNTPHMQEQDIQALLEKCAKLETQIARQHDTVSISTHQLRTSLSAFKWIFKMLLDGDTGPLTPEQQKLIEKSMESNERMIVLVSDMLNSLHTEDLSFTYKKEPVDFVALIDEVLFDFNSESFKRGVELLFLKPSPLPLLHTDKDKFRIVIQNLVENAIKYSNTGDKVFITITEENHSLILSVKDSGIGISPEDQGKIFSKFFRATNAQTKEQLGTGLGLSITKTIVEGLGGTISFKSALSEGTTFIVSLPI